MANVFLLAVPAIINLIHASIMVTEFSDWKSVTACTTEGASITELDCKDHVIQIGHSHYGVKSKSSTSTPASLAGSAGKFRCSPKFDDCVMDYTSKLGDRCNGLSKCSMSMLKQLIHKCREPATYIYFTYRCVKIPPQSNVCKPTEYRAKEAHLISPLFPYDYPKNVDCTCIVNRPDKTVLMTEDVSYQVLPPDVVTIQTENTKPVALFANNASTLIQSGGSTVIRFQSDSSLSRSGFWLKLAAYPTCSNNWEPVDDKCVRVVKHRLPWQFARQSCRKVGGHLLTIRDHVRKSRIHALLSKAEVNESVWIGLRRSETNTLVWDDGTLDDWKAEVFWPWDRSNSPSAEKECTFVHDQRWDMSECATPKYFICEQDLSRVKQEVLLTCGQSSNLVKASAYATRTRLLEENSSSRVLDLIDEEEVGFGKAPGEIGELSTNKRAISEQRFHFSVLKTSPPLATIRLCLILTFIILVLIALIACNIMLIYLCQKRLKKSSNLCDAYDGIGDSISSDTLHFWKCLSRNKKNRKRRQDGLFDLQRHLCPTGYSLSRNDCYWTCCKCRSMHLPASQLSGPYIDPLNSRKQSHFYESLLMHHKIADSGYSTVPKKPMCNPPASRSSARDKALGPEIRRHDSVCGCHNQSRPLEGPCALDELLFRKTLSRSPDSTSDKK